MGMSASSGDSEMQSEINVTPMVDIMLVLLIIFMVVTPFLQQGVTVAIPRDMNSPDVDPAIIKESSVVISIPEDNQFYIGKDLLAKDDLGPRIERMMKNKQEAEKIVYIKSGVGVSYGNVVEIINIIRKNGIDKIGLVADKKKKGGAAAPAAS
ncbi:MAG TPA: biopolymer transporter ExbD [Pyrinomonadaceae bacterium]|jgi:biopolymer transport protein ExbD/biopolymer transport protein TolR|nr:biopolymer transporter ExbD [Pyrinomonadaceae bacterium]